ncbi:Clr5 domain-containing protein [Podospora conica]|nr:Clr5 domain-containing protein [Schizothecium conicum]
MPAARATKSHTPSWDASPEEEEEGWDAPPGAAPAAHAGIWGVLLAADGGGGSDLGSRTPPAIMALPLPVPAPTPRPPRRKPTQSTPPSTAKPDFAKYKDVITDLYWRQDMALPKVVEMMAKEHKFIASVRQYKKKFKTWNLDKNITKDESEAMYRLQRIRRRRGKESAFYRHGLLLESGKVSRSIKSHGFGYEPRDDQVALPPTIRCETPKPRDNCRVLPQVAEEAVASPTPQPAASPFLLEQRHPFPEHGQWARPLPPQAAGWDVADDVSFGDMLAAPGEADLGGPRFSAAPVNHFAFDDPGPSPDFLADFEAISSSGFGSMPFGAPAPGSMAPSFLRPTAGWQPGHHLAPPPPQGNNSLFNTTWPPSQSHPFTAQPSFTPPFRPPPTPPPHFDHVVPPFHPPPTPPPTFDFHPPWAAPPNDLRLP